MGEKTRCPKWSASLPAQCELEAGHSGICDSGGDGFHGRTPEEWNAFLKEASPWWNSPQRKQEKT